MNTEKIELLEKTVAANPKDHKSWYELGLEFFETDFQKARECFFHGNCAGALQRGVCFPSGLEMPVG